MIRGRSNGSRRVLALLACSVAFAACGGDDAGAVDDAGGGRADGGDGGRDSMRDDAPTDARVIDASDDVAADAGGDARFDATIDDLGDDAPDGAAPIDAPNDDAGPTSCATRGVLELFPASSVAGASAPMRRELTPATPAADWGLDDDGRPL